MTVMVMMEDDGWGSRCEIGEEPYEMMSRLLDETRWNGDGNDGIPGLILWRLGNCFTVWYVLARV
jgi:hypothetical protein